jgi:type II secretory pathway pseudopilin PulG
MTLIELLVLMTIVAFLLGASVTHLQLLMRLDRNGRVSSERFASLDRLGRQLRRDAHDATDAEPFNESNVNGLRLRFSVPERTTRKVEYRVGKGEIVRIEASGDQTVRREIHTMPRLIEAKFEIRGDSGRRIVAIVSKTAVAKEADAPPLFDETLAAIGMDRSDTTRKPERKQP